MKMNIFHGDQTDISVRSLNKQLVVHLNGATRHVVVEGMHAQNILRLGDLNTRGNLTFTKFAASMYVDTGIVNNLEVGLSITASYGQWFFSAEILVRSP